MMLFKLLEVSHTNDDKFVVISLMDPGPIGSRIELLNIPLFTLSLKRGQFFNLTFLLKYWQLVNKVKPDVIQGWMYHGNIAVTLISLLMRLRFHKVKTYWNIRHSLYSLDKEKALTRLLIRLSKYLSKLPNGIIYNSVVSSKQHEKFGFSSVNSIVIPNGFDHKLFRPSQSIYAAFRKQLKCPSNTLLIGHFARYHPMKDHQTLLLAIHDVVKDFKNVYFILAGSNVTIDNIELLSLIEDLKLSQNIKLMGECSNMHEVFPALDLLVSSSAWGEGFPNVIGEALACEVPCVATDVGDSALVVDKFGKIVNPRDHFSLSSEIINMLELSADSNKMLGKEARKFVIANYSIDKISDKYLKLYDSE